MPKTQPFHIMSKPIGPICNIDCQYCYYLDKEKLYPKNKPGKSHWIMSNTVLESFIKQKFETSPIPLESFAWQGGEPTLLGVDYFRNIVRLQKKYANGKPFENAFQTNGILLNDEWCEFFKKHNFLVGVSIDGPDIIHDHYRVDKGGNPTFEKVMNGIELLKKHQVDFNTLTVVQKHNSYYPMEVYTFLKSIGSRYMQFIPIVEPLSASPAHGEYKVDFPKLHNKKASEFSVESAQFGKFLITIFDHWVRHDIGEYDIQTFNCALESWYGIPASICLFNETCGKAMALEHNGDLYACDHFVSSDYKLGNITQNSMASLVESNQQIKFGADKRDTLPEYCKQCEVYFACKGECPKNRFINTPQGEPGLNYLCEGYMMFFKHIDPYMQFMANELQFGRAPVNVKNWIVEQESKNFSQEI